MKTKREPKIFTPGEYKEFYTNIAESGTPPKKIMRPWQYRRLYEQLKKMEQRDRKNG